MIVASLNNGHFKKPASGTTQIKWRNVHNLFNIVWAHLERPDSSVVK